MYVPETGDIVRYKPRWADLASEMETGPFIPAGQLLKTGSFCSGIGGLDLATEAVFDTELVWLTLLALKDEDSRGQLTLHRLEIDVS